MKFGRKSGSFGAYSQKYGVPKKTASQPTQRRLRTLARCLLKLPDYGIHQLQLLPGGTAPPIYCAHNKACMYFCHTPSKFKSPLLGLRMYHNNPYGHPSSQRYAKSKTLCLPKNGIPYSLPCVGASFVRKQPCIMSMFVRSYPQQNRPPRIPNGIP